jgi:tRNA-specific 2-thiouridylase
MKFKRTLSTGGKIVFVGMSGGVDSSVAAGLLKKQGYDVVGVHLKCFNLDGCAGRDLEDARRAAEVLGIPFYVFDFEKEYKKRVIEYMINGYRKGITPNPDVMCNQEIKFGLFLDKALEMGADYVATGHYVKLKRLVIPAKAGIQKTRIPHQVRDDRQSAFSGSPTSQISDFNLRKSDFLNKDFFSLFQAADKNKDQSYFLWTLTQKQLERCLFPLGDIEKPEVRKLAQKFGLLNANKKDSRGVCFLGKINIHDFLKKYIKPKKGNIVDTEGNVIGRHDGVFYYTIGQRHGLYLDKAAKTPDSAPYYVADKILKTNTLIVAQGENNPALFKKEVKLTNINLINPKLEIKNLKLGIPVLARVRYRQPLFGATLVFSLKSPARPELNRRIVSCKLIFNDPQKFVAVGQSAVIYSKKGEMLGGGIIASV